MELTGWLEYFTQGLATQLKEVRQQGERVIKHDLILSAAAKAHLKEHCQSVLAFTHEKGKATAGECEISLAINRRTLIRDLKELVAKQFIREVATSPTDPTKYYESLL